jgi:amidase
MAALPALAGAREVATATAAETQPKPFELDEATIADLQAGMASGKYSSYSITEKYLWRIEEIDKRGPALASVIEMNPEAPAIGRPVSCADRCMESRC